MFLIHPSFEILSEINADKVLKKIEYAGRTCYQSFDKITDTSAASFVKRLIDVGHDSVIEHESITVKFVCDRGVANELVRHRMASYSQESTRYVSYKDGVTFIIPCWIQSIPEGEYDTDSNVPKTIETDYSAFIWYTSMLSAENLYKLSITSGWTPQMARCILPVSTKTDIIITANIREWRHILKLRCSKAAHPQIREVMTPLLHKLSTYLPEIFEDLLPSN